MSRLSGSARIVVWQERLDRYAKSDQSVTEFCKTEGVSVASFYRWKLRVSTAFSDSQAVKQTTRHRRQRQAGEVAAASFTELVVTGQQTTARAQLPNGVSIALGSDSAMAQVIVDRLLAYEPTTTRLSSQTAGRSSC